MSKFTPGKWWAAPSIFDGDAIFAPPQYKGRRNEVIAIGITNKADVRLIVHAPEMYELLKTLSYRTSGMEQHEVMSIRELLARIDGEEAEE